MIASAIVVVLVLLLLGISFVLTRTSVLSRNGGKQTDQQLHPVDVEAFRNLIDPQEEEYLRARLKPSEFRRIQRQRLAAAVEYIHGASRNAGILLHMADAARQSTDPAVVQSAEILIEQATQLRLYAYQAVPRLYFAMAFPSWKVSPVRVAEGYEEMTRQVVSLRTHYPMSEVSSAL
ncbi:MAG TPA: hypothetical protein VMB18_13345 [Terriglobales bacterium]|nr:hypothetical protein [Terriglobales bacterium]